MLVTTILYNKLARTIYEIYFISETNPIDRLIKIFPLSSNYRLPLNAHSRFFCRYYPMAVIVFNEQLDIERFLAALENALNYFPFLFGKLQDDGQNLSVSFSNTEGYEEEKAAVICELAISSDCSYLNVHESVSSYLPQHLPSQTYTLPDDVNGLIMIQFRVTQCQDGFVLGYTFNHACLDQASMLYFLNYLSAVYNHEDLSQFAPPEIVDTFSLLEPKHKKKLENQIEFASIAHTIGREHKSTCAILPIVDHTQIQISLNKDALKKYCHSSDMHCSTNDLINAMLIKMYLLQNEHSLTHNTIQIEIAANCRAKLGLGDSTIGNLVSTIAINDISIDIAKSASLIELAIMLRQHVKAYSEDNFLKIVNWYYQSTLAKTNIDDYVASYLVNPSIIITTNWNGFDYSRIHFEKSKLLAILQPPQPFYRLFMGVITFDYRFANSIVLNCQIPTDILDAASMFCKSLPFFIELIKA